MYPFREGDTFATFGAIRDAVIHEIMGLDNLYILKASPAELEEYFLGKSIINPLVLQSDKQYIRSQSGTEIDVSHDFNRANFHGGRPVVRGTKIELAIPFEGDPMLWRLSASTWSTGGYPEIDIMNDEIVMSVCFPDDSINPGRIKTSIERGIKSLEEAVRYLRDDVIRHNDGIKKSISQTLSKKREMAQAAVGAIAQLGIPIKRVDASPAFVVPAKRRSQICAKPPVETGMFSPEPVLDMKEYEHILEVLRSMSLVIERNPTSFASLDEESIRDHFLIQLNGHYEGSATGETFNAAGKTDILIRSGNRNVFIAECKFWRGNKVFLEAVDQLLGYLTWRDTKCAIMIFNRTKDSSSVRLKMHEAMQGVAEYRKTIHHNPDGESRYILIKRAEPGREVIVTTQLYEIPSEV